MHDYQNSHQRWLQKLKLMCSGNAGHARFSTQDLVQEVAIQVSQQHAEWDKVGGQYLQAVVKGHAAKAHRFHNQELRKVSRDRPLTDTCADQLSPQAILEKRELELRLAEVLPLLEEVQQRVVTLRFFEKANFQQIADVLGITDRQASLVMQRALKELKRLLEASTDDDQRSE